MEDQKLFTKSAFKVALTCPAQLYYYRNKRYANQQTVNDFLQGLAEGGFQVGELAKIYCEVDDGCDLGDIRGYDESVAKTNELLKRDRVTIAEAAFRFGNLFIRADIVRKNGDRIDLIEVKAKSWNPDDPFVKFSPKLNQEIVERNIREYVYDVAFQKYVVESSLRERGVRAGLKSYLMLADKSKVADVAGINQCFKIRKCGDRTIVERSPEALALKDHVHVLSLFNMDEACDKIYRGQVADAAEMFRGQTFEEFVKEKSAWYCENSEHHYAELSTRCYQCPFFSSDKLSGEDGYDECWKHQAHFTDDDLKRPLLEELWGGGNTKQRGVLFKLRKYFLRDITAEDIGTPKKPSEKPGLDYCQRKIVQVGLATGRPAMLGELQCDLQSDGAYLDVSRLKAEMAEWKFPLHMIDFETTAVALPFYAKLRPYEQVAFQFSHHIIDSADGGRTYMIRHAGQYINTEKGKFPNFEFVRELKRQLENDSGSVFRYAAHENTILNAVRKQLRESDEPDRAELIAFIETLTQPSQNDKEDGRPAKTRGVRNMIDLCDVVKRYFYHPSMKGSNSIKEVLPAVLNVSKFLQEKYSKPIYGGEIVSRNFSPADLQIWVRFDEDGRVIDPYHALPSVAHYMPEGLLAGQNDFGEFDGEDNAGFTVNKGGEALTAYSMLQFCDRDVSEALRSALLRYCELDTMAMVFIWEYFNFMTKR